MRIHKLSAVLGFVGSALMVSVPMFGQTAVGTGRTFGEAMMNAQINAGFIAMAQETGRAMGEMRNAKIDLTLQIQQAREKYWRAVEGGGDTEQAERAYLEMLWKKDLYYLVIGASNHLRPVESDRGNTSSIQGIGDLVDKLTFFTLDDGIPGYAKVLFDGWVAETYRLLTAKKKLGEALTDAVQSYTHYYQRRNQAEFLFRNPRSPLLSSDSREYYAGWLLATDNRAKYSQALEESRGAYRAVGATVFEKVVDELRRGRIGTYTHDDSLSTLSGGLGNMWLQLAAVDWQMTRHDPDLYAIYLIKRWTGCDWEMATALQDARSRRLGRENVARIVREAYAHADDPLPAETVRVRQASFAGDPYKQQRMSGRLADPVAHHFGQFTIWEDALDVSTQRMDRAAMRKIMLQYLSTLPGNGSTEVRYARIVQVVDETLLLAAIHQAQTLGLESLCGGRRSWGKAAPFAEEYRILEVFAAARDDRTYAVRELVGVDSTAESSWLERAVESYRERIARHGEAKVLKAANLTRRAATVSIQGIVENGNAFRQLLDEGGTVAREQARAQRQTSLDRTIVGLELEFSGGLVFSGALMRYYTEQARTAIRAEQARSKIEPTVLSYRADAARAAEMARSKLDAMLAKLTATLREAAAAYERFEATRNSLDRTKAEAARAFVTTELRFAYDRVIADDKALGTSQFALIGQSAPDLLKWVSDLFALYDPSLGAKASAVSWNPSAANAEKTEEQLAAVAKSRQGPSYVTTAAFFSKLEENKKVVRLPSGLCYEIIRLGNGQFPKATSTVKVHFTGALVDGSVFDSTVQRGEPMEFPLDAVMPGWTEGIQKVSKGGKIKLYIPANLAYGDRAPAPIPPGAALIFEVELLDIKAATAPAPAMPAKK